MDVKRDEKPEKILTDKIEVDIIQLSKVKREYEKNKNNEKAQWMLFIDDQNSKEVQEIIEKNEEIKEAVVTVHKMSEYEKLRRLAELREKAIMDEKAIYSAGIDKGVQQGERKTTISIAKK